MITQYHSTAGKRFYELEIQHEITSKKTGKTRKEWKFAGMSYIGDNEKVLFEKGNYIHTEAADGTRHRYNKTCSTVDGQEV